jgi:hypothetical protein
MVVVVVVVVMGDTAELFLSARNSPKHITHHFIPSSLCHIQNI